MRRFAVLFIILGAASGAWAQTVTTTAPRALVMDVGTGAVLFDKAADEPTAPASVVKLMTAELVFRDLKSGKITLDTQFPISEHAWKTARGGASMFARLGANIRVEDLLRGMIVQSGADAAVALAEGLGGSEESFAGMMNKRAAELGMSRSHFVDSWGAANPAQTVSARDLARLAEHVIKTYPEYYHFFGEKEFTWSKIRQVNRNPILFNEVNGDGLKVGNLPDGGFNLVGSAVNGDRRLIVVVLDAKTAKDRAEEARKLFNWGFRGFEVKELLASDEQVGVAKVYGGAKSEAPLLTTAPVRLMASRGSTDKITGRIVYTGPLLAPVAAGTVVARLKIFSGSTLAMDVPLKTGEAVELGDLSQRAKDAAFELGLQIFHKTLSSGFKSAKKAATNATQ
ncbi:D-alanyl-D-alanine carboxypeptidase (penicillin-binding protein 5/6) [Rhodoblastus acidophilus]|nr:D-alanyl-D-alanine carboxypeptidase family protein [Rhodoblastus acidophilus]MCW2273496.1 D-alanyl-D-alanine carboxypeptidase (penicillin-binding protein 5/6) [Rhodoblastus acidophilus]